jgi:hypothetical protein
MVNFLELPKAPEVPKNAKILGRQNQPRDPMRYGGDHGLPRINKDEAEQACAKVVGIPPEV